MINETSEMVERSALDRLVKAWDSLPEGEHSVPVINRWLKEDMHPAIATARAALKPQPQDTETNLK